MSELIVRCSSISKLMAKPENADLEPSLVTADVEAIIAKTKRTDAEKATLEAVRRKSLSAGGKTHVRELVREVVYAYEPAEVQTRPILKGLELEGDALDMLARLSGRPLVKNTERRSNGFISGECDVFDAPIRHGRDIKVPYSMENMPIVLADCYDAGYWWQMQGYMILWDADTWSVDYLLLSTPEELVGFEPVSLHYVDHIAERLRWTTWLVKRDPALQSLIEDKVLAARRYYREVLNEFDRTHGGKVPEVAEGEEPPLPPAPAAKPAAKTAAAPAAAIPAPSF